MTKKSHTSDERYMISVYELAMHIGDWDEPIDRYEAGKNVGLNPKGVDAISKLLIQANFIKKRGDSEIVLTEHGKNLVLRLLGER